MASHIWAVISDSSSNAVARLVGGEPFDTERCPEGPALCWPREQRGLLPPYSTTAAPLDFFGARSRYLRPAPAALWVVSGVQRFYKANRLCEAKRHCVLACVLWWCGIGHAWVDRLCGSNSVVFWEVPQCCSGQCDSGCESRQTRVNSDGCPSCSPQCIVAAFLHTSTHMRWTHCVYNKHLCEFLLRQPGNCAEITAREYQLLDCLRSRWEFGSWRLLTWATSTWLLGRGSYSVDSSTSPLRSAD